MRLPWSPPLLALALLIACGDDSSDGETTTTTSPTAPPATQSVGDTTTTTADPTTTTIAAITTTLDVTTTAHTSTTDTTTTGDTTIGGDPSDPFGPPPPMNLWPAGPSDHETPSGVPFHVEVPVGDTSSSLLVIGGFYINILSPADNAITIYINSDGVLGPRACPGPGMSGVPHNLFADVVHEVLLAAGESVQFDHKRAFIEADGNNAGWGMTAGLDPQNQPFLAGIYTPWAEYNNAPCTGVTAPADADSPKTMFVSKNACDDTYCPLKACIATVQALGYDVTFMDPLSPASCDCLGPCPGAIERPHFKGPGDPSAIKPWVLATTKP
jgi:hypothetical protein